MLIHRVTSDQIGWFLTLTILDEVFDDPVQPHRLTEFVGQTNHALLIAVDGSTVTGHIRGMMLHHPDAGPDLYIDNIGVAPFYRRQGIASRLMEAIKAWAHGQDSQELWVLAEPENAPARAFYSHHGLTVRDAKLFGH